MAKLGERSMITHAALFTPEPGRVILIFPEPPFFSIASQILAESQIHLHHKIEKVPFFPNLLQQAPSRIKSFSHWAFCFN
jgi:hypothetical protein